MNPMYNRKNYFLRNIRIIMQSMCSILSNDICTFVVWENDNIFLTESKVAVYRVPFFVHILFVARFSFTCDYF